jgi:hypothetical protein
MATIDRDILTIVEPTIEVDMVFVEDEESQDAKKESSPENQNQTMSQQSYEGGVYPMVQIGSNKILQEDLDSMELNLEGLIPTATFTVSDTTNKFTDVEYPLDGTVVSLYLRPRPIDEYRPIRIDFDILKITSSPAQPSSEDSEAVAPTYTFTCIMKIPLMFADVIQGFAAGNSFDHLLECAEGLGLGFASNEDSTDDSMPRIIAQSSRDEFINQTTMSAYKDDESFFDSYVDLQYYLCFVNVNKQFSEEDEMETVKGVSQINTELQTGSEPNAEDGFQASLRLSNGQDVSGSDMAIASYNLVNNSGEIWMSNGYARQIKYLNLNENNNGGQTGGLESFLITPLNTPGSEENRIPLRGRADEDYWEDNNKIKYLGKQASEDFENVHSNYMYAIANNLGNKDEISKMILEVDLEVVNWSLYKYQRIPVIIYNEGEVNSKTLENRDSQLGDDIQPAAAKDEAGDEVKYDGPNQQVKNEFLSGYYVISDITYKYNKEDTKITQSLKLLRREWPIPAKNKDN